MGYDYQTADPMLYSLLKDLAKKNREHPTPAESALWKFLKNNALGCTFKRQHVVGAYIADFICIQARLIIEIDGGYHQLPEQQISDLERQQWLESQGFKVIRFTNEEVMADIERVIDTIERFT
jgi:very-short-patch-repair endonuclease